MVGEAEIIVATKRKTVSSVYDNLRALRTLQSAARAVEVLLATEF
jgi:hypothetical protein